MEINFDIKEDCLPYFSFVVKTGSCEETELNNGISHLIEHLTVSNITCSPSKIGRGRQGDGSFVLTLCRF